MADSLRVCQLSGSLFISSCLLPTFCSSRISLHLISWSPVPADVSAALFLNIAWLQAWGAWNSAAPKSRRCLERRQKLMGCQEAGDSKSLGKHGRITTAVANLWLLCAGCKLWPWVWPTPYNWQYRADGCWIPPTMDWKKKQGTGTPWPTWMGFSGIPQNTVFLPVSWQISGTHLLPKLHSSLPSSSHLSKAHSLCHEALSLVKILEHMMSGDSQPRRSRKFPQISTSILRH